MSGRSYLSIGDVLTLLRQEFPDVTISKIRFLESQGLVNPERTPSGYRKFYEPDVERLRWVLRQQREHFLPLKVIKGRLEQESDGEEAEGYESWSEDDFEGDHEPALVGRRAIPEGAVPATDAMGEALHGDSGLALPGFESAARISEDVIIGAGTHESMSPRAAVGATRDLQPPRMARVPGGQPPKEGAGSNAGVLRGQGGQKARGEASRPSSPSEPPEQPDSGRHPSSRSVPAAPAPPPPLARSGSNGTPGTTMTLEELAATSGLAVADVSQLESYGLLAGKIVGGVAYYDEDAVTIARSAAGFAAFGIEARHLRLFKNAADREAGLVEQIVLPLLKQRNPESRQRALDTVDELTRLGQSLRSVLVRAALRDQLGG